MHEDPGTHDEAGDDQPRPTPPPSSILGQLGQRRAQLAAAQKLTLRIPRWGDDDGGPRLFVIYRLLGREELQKANQAIEKAKAPVRNQVEWTKNLDVLVNACEGVFAILPDDFDKARLADCTRYSLNPEDPEGELTRFDAALAASFGMDPDQSSARQVIQHVFISDGDILQHFSRLAEWSGYTNGGVDGDLEGE